MVELNSEMRWRLRSARRNAGLTQKKVALKLGVTQPTIQRLEAENPNRKNVSDRQISELAKLYECEEKYLLLGIKMSPKEDTGSLAGDASKTDATEKSERTCLDDFLLPSYPRNFLSELSGATELKLTGLNLRRIEFKHIPDLKQVLDRQGKIKVLLLAPGCKACKYAAIQDRGSKANIKTYIGTIREMLAELCKLRRGPNRQNIEIRTIDYALTFGLDMINAEKESGIIYVRYYPLNSLRTNDDKPILRLAPSDGRWYSFYKDQFDLHWDMAKNWRCSGKSQAKRFKRHRS